MFLLKKLKKKNSFHVRLNHIDPIKNKFDFCLTKAQWREREREGEERD